MRVCLDGLPLNWKHGLVTVRKLRFLFNPLGVIYELNTRMIKVDLYKLYGFMRRSVDLIYPGYSLLFLTGYGSYCKILDNIDIVHCIGSLRKYNKPTLYEIDFSPIEFFYYYSGIPLSKLMHVYHYFDQFFKTENRVLITWQPSNVRIIRKLGFDESKINYVPPPIPIIERNKEVDNEEPTILFVGHNFILKGGSIALKAFEIINKEIPKSKLIFVSQFTPPTKYSNIVFTGPIENDVLKRNYLPFVDLLLAPFKFNCPSCLSLLEAMSAGIPVISTYHPLLEDYVIDGFNGYSVKQYSPKNFAEKTIELLQDKNKLKVMSKNAINYINEKYSPKYVASKLLMLYKTLISKYET
jgi:glycosyltransferase involved in cell wall biosynthesis